MRPTTLVRPLAFAILALVVAAPAHAVDGVKLINQSVAVNGTAWDELIVPGDTSVPSNNFDHYTVHFQKQGAAGWAQLIDSSTSIPLAGSPVGVGVLVDWDLQTVDAASNPLGLSADQLLAPGEACSYVLMLQAWDNTLVGESTVHYHSDLFPVKIINAPIA